MQHHLTQLFVRYSKVLDNRRTYQTLPEKRALRRKRDLDVFLPMSLAFEIGASQFVVDGAELHLELVQELMQYPID